MALRALLLLSLALAHCGQATAAPRKGPVEQPGGCSGNEVAYRYCGDLLCHSLTPKLPFARALAACRKINGRLTTIHSQEHNDLLYGMLTESTFIGAVARQRMERHPRQDQPGVIWSWLSGEEPHFTNILRNETRGYYRQPDGGGFEGCIELMKHPVLRNDHGNSRWGDTDCRAPKPALCTRTVRAARPRKTYETRVWRYETRRERRAGCAAGFLRVGVERLGERGGRSTCLSGPQEARNMSAALLRCQELDPPATVSRAARLAGRRRWFHPVTPESATLVWAGAERRNARLQWRWQEDGRAVPRAAWAAYEPRDKIGADCAAYDVARRGMVAADCGAPLPFACEAPARGCDGRHRVAATGLKCVREDPTGCQGVEEYVTPPAAAPAPAPCEAALCPLACPPGATQLGLKCWEVHDAAKRFVDSARYCMSRGMRNVKVDSEEENEFLRRQAVRLALPLWLSRESPNFSRWRQYVPYGLPAEPNEHPIGDTRSVSCSIVWFDGEWMDVDCFLEFPFVCERPIEWTDCAAGVEAVKSADEGGRHVG